MHKAEPGEEHDYIEGKEDESQDPEKMLEDGEIEPREAAFIHGEQEAEVNEDSNSQTTPDSAVDREVEALIKKKKQ